MIYKTYVLIYRCYTQFMESGKSKKIAKGNFKNSVKKVEHEKTFKIIINRA
jgi:hypothetical protein